MKSNIMLATVAGLLMTVQSNAGEMAKSATDTATTMGECHGVNECKGKGECGSQGHSCAGMNTCKGQGWVTTSEADCKKKKPQWTKNGPMMGDSKKTK